jgi:beta-lactamase class A
MSFSRRNFVAHSAACVCAAGCAPRLRPAPGRLRLDAAELSQGNRTLSARARPGLLDLGVVEIGSGRAWFGDATGQYPMAGVSKLPIVAAALALVDAGHLRLNQRVRLTLDDLSPPRGSGTLALAPPPGGAVEPPLADLIALAIQRGDSTAGDAVLRLAGGPRAVTEWLRARGVEGVRVDRYDREWVCDMLALGPFRPAWGRPAAFAEAVEGISPAVRQSAMDAYLGDPRDTATAPGISGVLARLDSGTLLGSDSTRFLLALMGARADGGRGLAAGLRPGAILAGVGGSTPTSLGFTAADNEVGVAQLTDGRRLAITVFVAGSTATATARSRLIADAARLVAGGGPAA